MPIKAEIAASWILDDALYNQPQNKYPPKDPCRISGAGLSSGKVKNLNQLTEVNEMMWVRQIA